MSTFSGTATTGIVLGTGTYTNPLTVTSTGYISNTTVLKNGDAIYGPTGTAWTVDNYGRVNATNGTAASGIHFLGGGLVENTGTGFIGGVKNGVSISGGAGTVINSATIIATGTTGNGVYITAGGSLSNASTGIITGYDGVRIAGGVGNLVNYGSIASTGTGFGAQGIDFLGGGTLTNYGTILGINLHASGINAGFASDTIINGGPSDAGALIEGQLNGIDQFSSSGTVVNFATVISTGGDGVYLQAGGSLSNSGTVALISGSSDGVRIGGATGTVNNNGTITATGAAGIGVRLGSGGLATNASTGLITGKSDGVFINGSAGTVANSGSIIANGNTFGVGIAINNANGAATNSSTGLISGTNIGISLGGTAPGSGYIVNQGTIRAPGSITNGSGSITGGNAINFSNGGRVTNGTAGLIEGYHIGVFANTSATTAVVNFGTIKSDQTAANGNSGEAVLLQGGGSVANYGLIQSAQGNGVSIGSATGGVGTVVNLGTIRTTGSLLSPQGFHADAVVLNSGGTLVNGAATATSALIIAYERGVYGGGFGAVPTPGARTTIVNYGTISGTGTNVATAATNIALVAGGLIVNRGLISTVTRNAVSIGTTSFASTGTVVNYGTIVRTATGTVGGHAVYLAAGGTVINSGSLGSNGTGFPASGGTGGYPAVVQADNARGTVFNFATITSTHSNGVNFDNGGLLVNGSTSNSTAIVYGYHRAFYAGGRSGVPISGAVATVVNYGTLASGGTASATVGLSSGGTVLNRGLITGPRTAISFTNTTVAGTVDNFGSVISTAAATATAGSGIYMQAGGTVTNETGATIQAIRNAISFNDTAGTTVSFGSVVNYGTIRSTGSNGVYFAEGGNLTNAATGLITGSSDGVKIAGSAGTVTNLGTITGSGGVYPDAGVALHAGGTIINAAGALISGGWDGAHLNGGIIDNSGTVTASLQSAVFLAGGTAINESTGLLSGTNNGIFENNTAAARIVNYGTIKGQNFYGVYLGLGGSVTNRAAGTIAGPAAGIKVFNLAGTVGNYGSIVGSGAFSDAIQMFAGGTVGNAATGVILGSGRRGVFIYGGTGTVTNSGTIKSVSSTYVGVYLKSGGTVINNAGGLITASTVDGIAIGHGAGTVINAGSIGGIYLEVGGLVTNSGQLNANEAVRIAGSAGTVSNLGTIVGTGSAAVTLTAGGTVANGSTAAATALIAGASGGVYVGGGAGTLGNFGTIKSTSPTSFDGVYLKSGGNVNNAGLIAGLDGVDLRVGGTVSNSGTIIGYGSGNVAGIFLGFTYTAGAFRVTNSGTVASSASAIIMRGAGNVTNQAGGLIRGGAAGVAMSGAGTIDNFGTITGTSGTAVTLGSATDTIVIEQGSTIVGAVAHFNGSDAIDVPFITFSSANTATLDSSNVLTISGGGKSTTVQLDSSVSGKTFVVSNDGSGGTEATLAPPPPPPVVSATLFSFIFVYNDGKDYYLGTVADDGTFGYLVGGTQTSTAGTYTILGSLGTTSEAAGTIAVTFYSHQGVGEASPTPLLTASGAADGTGGLGSEIDSLSGLDQLTHFFSSTQEASFTTTALFGFVYTFADGTSYSGTVADGSGSALPTTKTVLDGNGNLIGTYKIFADGLSGRASGTVVVDRYTAGGQSFVPVHASTTSVDGTLGLGSEAGLISVNGVTVGFSDTFEPAIGASLVTAPAVPAPSSGTVVGDEVDQIFSDILGRAPTASELDAYSSELSGGTSVATIRAAIAGTSEAQHDLSQLYQQVLDRAASGGELSSATSDLTNGSSLRTEQLVLADSSEAQSAINQIYEDVLGRAVDPDGLAAYVAQLGDESSSALADPGGKSGLEGVRDVVAHSGEAAKALTTLFQNVLGRAPGAAELVGMEDQLAVAGTTETTLETSLENTGSAGGYTTLTAPAGSTTLTAAAGTPTLFVFTNIAFGNDTISGFDGSRDTIELPKTLAPDLTTLNNDTTSVNGGSLITFNSSQSIFISNTAPTLLNSSNFLLV